MEKWRGKGEGRTEEEGKGEMKRNGESKKRFEGSGGRFSHAARTGGGGPLLAPARDTLMMAASIC